jgi:hypothetical protein
MGIPYGLLLDIAAVLLIIAAFVRTDEDRVRVVLGVVFIIVIVLPLVMSVRPLSALWWIFSLCKLVAAVSCAVYIKLMG